MRKTRHQITKVLPEMIISLEVKKSLIPLKDSRRRMSLRRQNTILRRSINQKILNPLQAVLGIYLKPQMIQQTLRRQIHVSRPFRHHNRNQRSRLLRLRQLLQVSSQKAQHHPPAGTIKSLKMQMIPLLKKTTMQRQG